MDNLAFILFTTVYLTGLYVIFLLFQTQYNNAKVIINSLFILLGLLHFRYMIPYGFDIIHMNNDQFENIYVGFRVGLFFIIIFFFPIGISILKKLGYNMYNVECGPYFYIINFVNIFFIFPTCYFISMGIINNFKF